MSFTMSNRWAIVLAPLALVPCAVAQPTGYDGHKVVRVAVTSEAQLAMLRELEAADERLEIWTEVAHVGPLEVRASPAALEALDAAGMSYTVMVPDLQAWLNDHFSSAQRSSFFVSLRTYDEHVQFMNDLVATYPNLAQMVDVGSSVQGRTMWALRITGPGSDKPALIYHGAQHGNEAAGASVVAYIAEHLLTHYDSDPDVAALVDNIEWYLLPIMNPDGYVAYKRRNAHGIDLNRNWGGDGSGEDPSGGTTPFSEPETAAMRDFLLSHPNVRVHIDYHGYVRWLMWPWGHRATLCKDHWTFRRIVEIVEQRIRQAGGAGYAIGNIWDVAYTVSGGSVDYSYGELGIWGLAFEVADSQMPDICEEFLNGSLYVGQWLYDCDGDGVPDIDEIASEPAIDLNGNQVIDTCECFGDVTVDGVVDLTDLGTLLQNYGRTTGAWHRRGDLDRDGDVDLVDLGALLGAYGTDCR